MEKDPADMGSHAEIRSVFIFCVLPESVMNGESIMNDVNAKIKKSPERLYKWDNIKFFLILCVVLGHFSSVVLEKSAAIDTVFLYTLSFHMPLFIFISGLFTKSYQDKPLNGNKIFGLLTICLLYKLLLLLVNIYYENETISVSVFSDISAPWYLFVLVIFMGITYLVRNIRPAYVLGFAIVLSLISGYDAEIGRYMSLSRIIVFFPYFYAGYILEPEKVAKALDKLWLKIIAIIGLIAAAVYVYLSSSDILYYRGLGTGLASYRAIEVLVNNGETVGMTQRLITYVVAVIMSIFIISLIPNSRIPFISDMGTRTLQVYVLHRPILLIMQYEGTLPWIRNHIGSFNWGGGKSRKQFSLGVLLAINRSCADTPAFPQVY